MDTGSETVDTLSACEEGSNMLPTNSDLQGQELETSTGFGEEAFGERARTRPTVEALKSWE